MLGDKVLGDKVLGDKVLGDKVLGDPALASFAAFGSFALLLLSARDDAIN